jgi:hypothetical protein
MILDGYCVDVFMDVIGDIVFVFCPGSDGDSVKQWIVSRHVFRHIFEVFRTLN